MYEFFFMIINLDPSFVDKDYVEYSFKGDKTVARMMRVLGIVVLGFIVSSCTRDMDKAESVRLDLSSFTKSGLSAQSTSTLEINFIAVNVTVDGALQASCKFDPEFSARWTGGCLAHPDFPNNPTAGVEFPSVPTGNALVQVLVVGEESDSSNGGGGGEVFKYGEGTAPLTSSGSNPVIVNVKAAEATEDREGAVAGRYGTTYTGRVALQYVPDTGNPMTVFHLDMFAGWFEIFLLDGVPLQYKMIDDPEGRTLFGGKVAIDSPQWYGGDPSVLGFSHDTIYFEDGEQEGGEFNAIGFWTEDGAPDTSASICYDNTATYADYKYTDSLGVNTLSWPNDFVVTGGSGTCALSYPLVDSSQMKIGGELILNSEGGDNSLFRGPFRAFLTPQGKPDMMYAYASGTELTVQWEYLPGVTSSPKYKGVSIYYTNTYEGDISREFEGAEGLNCYSLESDSKFVGHFERYDVFGSAESVTFDAGVELANKGLVLACPRRSDEALGRDRYFNIAVGSGVYRAPATSLKIQGLAGVPYPHINKYACTALEVVGLDDNDLRGELKSDDGDYTVSFSSAIGAFYEDPSCGTQSGTLDMENGYDLIYYKATITGAAGIGVHTDPSETEALPSDYLNVSVVTTSPADGMLLYATDYIWSTQCIPFLFAIVDADGVPTSHGADVTVTLSSSQAGGTFWADYDSYCQSSQMNSNNIYNGDTYGVLNYKPGGVASGSETVYVSTSQGVLTNDDIYEVEVARPPNASYMRLETMDPYYGSGSTCHSMYIATYIPGDGGQSPKVYPESTLNYAISATGSGTMTFYTDSGCTSSTSNFSQSNTQAEVPVYFKVTSTGEYNIDVTESSVGGQFNFSTSLDVQP